MNQVILWHGVIEGVVEGVIVIVVVQRGKKKQREKIEVG
jgi:hypothetical protein